MSESCACMMLHSLDSSHSALLATVILPLSPMILSVSASAWIN